MKGILLRGIGKTVAREDGGVVGTPGAVGGSPHVQAAYEAGGSWDVRAFGRRRQGGL